MERRRVTSENLDSLINKAVDVLSKGGIVIYPTETCYGVGVMATDENAVKKVLNFKSRPEGKPISIAVTDKKMASEYVEINPTAENIYDNLLPGPITVISKSLGKVSKEIESEKGTLGIRIPAHDIPLEIVKRLGKPMTSTSANVSGRKTPYTIEDVLDELTDKKKEMIDLIIDLGTLPKNPPSTVIDTTLMGINVVRQGIVQMDDVNKVFDLKEENEMADVAKFIFEKFYNKNQVLFINLDGPMGAGKTHFVKYLGKLLDTKDRVNSPTFTIHHEYEFNENKIHHLDLWRLENKEDVPALEIEKHTKIGDIIAIEWASKFVPEVKAIADVLNSQVVNIFIDINSQTSRKVLVSYKK